MDLAQKEKQFSNSYDCHEVKTQCRGDVLDTQNTI